MPELRAIPEPRSRRLALLAAALLGLLLAACQPSPEERLASAQEYVEAANYPAAIIELKNTLRDQPDNVSARLLMADASYQMADFATAADEYTRALELGAASSDTKSDAWIGLGRSLLRMGDAVEAFERVQPNLAEAGNDPRELVLLGDMYASLGNYANATRVFQRAVELDPASVNGLTGLAVVEGALGNREEARNLLEQATRADETAPRPWIVLGNFERMSGNLQAATEAYQNAVDRDTAFLPLSDRFDARASLVSAAIDNRDTALARSGIDALQLLFPGHPTLYFLRGRLAFAEGDADTATTELQEYLSRLPNDLRAHAVMGAISFSQNYYSQAEMYLQQAVRGNAGGETARRLLAETRLRMNRPGDALDLLRESGTSGDADPALLGLLGRAEFSSGNRAAGLEYFEQGRRSAPDDPGMNLMYAMALISDGQNDSAIAVLEGLPEFEDARHRREMLLIAAHLRNDDAERAHASAAALIAANPDDAMAHALVGSFKRGIRDNAAAEKHFRDAVALDASNELALFGLATLAIESGEIETAREALGVLLDAEPASMPALSMLGRIAVPAGDFDAYRSRLDTAIVAAPRAAGPRLLRGRVELVAGDAEQALSYVRESRELFPELAAFRHLEGLALLRLDQTESALISLARAAAAEPDTPQYAFDLAIARLQARDYFGAVEAIDTFRELRPDEPLGLSVFVNAKIGQRRYAEAQQAIDEFPAGADHPSTIAVLSGDVALAEDRGEDAVRYYEQAGESRWDRGLALRQSSAYLAIDSPKAPEPLARWLAEHPDDAAARRAYGQMLQTGGDSTAAIAEYERVLRENENDPVALNNLAWEYSIEGRPEAVDLARRAYNLRPDVGSIADTYGWILYKNGDLDKAARVLREAATLSPENGEIQFHLARVLADTGARGEATDIITRLLDSDLAFPSRADAVELAESL